MSLSTKTSIGSRDKKITIQRAIIIDGSANSDIVESWEDVCAPWARITSNLIHGHEQYEADRLTAEQVTIFNIRYRAGLDKKMRIIWGSFIYQIVAIIDNNRKIELDLKAELLDESLT